MNYYEMVLGLIGGIGLFFYGMHTMSESLQGIAGNMMRQVVNYLTTNRFIAVFVGVVVTVLVQSSSITTVMIVSFVNAGLMNLTQALGVILGANIGTTITGWIIAFSVGKYGLPLLGFGSLIYLFVKQEKWKLLGKLMFGLGGIFFGLKQMSGAFKPLRTNEEFISKLSMFEADTISSVLLCVFVGTILTMIIQSSSAMLAITISLALTDVISFPTAAALVLGENIGTTITALLASISTTVSAKRAAFGHMLFNVSGVILMIIIFGYYIDFIEWILPSDTKFVTSEGEKPVVAKQLALFHTIFNISATCVAIWFLPFLAKVASFIIPDSKSKQKHQLTTLGDVNKKVPSLSIEQAHNESKFMAKLVLDSLIATKDFALSENLDSKKVAIIHDIEKKTDKIQMEITVFLCEIMETRLTQNQSQEVFQLINIIDNLESIADYCDKIVEYRNRISQTGMKFNQDTLNELSIFLTQVLSFYKKATDPVFYNGIKDYSYFDKKTKELGFDADEIKKNHIERTKEGIYPPLMALAFSDLIVSIRRIKNHSLNIAEHAHQAYN